MLPLFAEPVLATSCLAPSWRDNLHATFEIGLRADNLTLDPAAQQLAISRRTLQRRLRELGTN
ncbi:hypothetical protein [Nocardia tengchongensis]|uniref:hypothetical protein n=1 Tax=Nocardia tengchongensis TaxID=2055889 RepID=UPI003619C09B